MSAFTQDELETLYAVCDTIIPAASADDLQAALSANNVNVNVPADTLAAFAAETPSSNDAFRLMLTTTLPAALPPHKRDELRQVLSLLRYVESRRVASDCS